MLKQRNEIPEQNRRSVVDHFSNVVVKNGPTTECKCCGCLWFLNQTTNVKKEKIAFDDDLLMRFLFEDDNVEIRCCKTCAYSLKLKKRPTIALINVLEFPRIPLQITQLNRIEERLVAIRHVFQSIYSIKGNNGQFRSVGAIQNIPVEYDTSVSVLPRTMNDTNIVAIKLARRMSDSKDYLQGNIRPRVVWEAARILRESPLYQKLNIVLDDGWLQQTIDEVNLATSVDDGDSESDDEVLDQVPIGGEETLFTGQNYIRMAPAEGKSPLSVLRDDYVDFLAFPRIYAGHILEPKTQDKPLSYHAFTRSVIRRADRRGVVRDYLFFMDRKKLLSLLVSGTNIMMRKSQGILFTATEALDNDSVTSLMKKDRAYQVFDKVRSSPEYWKVEKQNLMAMIGQLGIPTLFVTISAAETKWKELIIILKRVLDGETIDESAVDELTSTEVARLIQSDPVTCALYFDHRFRELKRTWKSPDGPFGEHDIKDYYYRIEFQQRGSPHVHMLVWLKNVPIYVRDNASNSDNSKEICGFVDKVISCKYVDKSENGVLHEMVTTRQTHQHTHTCWKKKRNNEKVCRFNIPFFPMDTTCILNPLPDVSTLAIEEVNKRGHLIEIS